MISLILADAEVERVPICADGPAAPRVCSLKDSEVRGIIILDSYIHRHILEGLEGVERRGRPDIVHSFLLLAQSSRACEQGKLRSYLHTRGDEVVLVGCRYRPEQSYVAFLGSLGTLFEKGELGSVENGLRLERSMGLKDLIYRLNPDEVIALTPLGTESDLREVLRDASERHLAVIIGGFPEGDYRSQVYEMAEVKVSLGKELLTVPDVTSQVLASIP
jgi:rRNA small subunit pseudouridine methyltransferase Nep1